MMGIVGAAVITKWAHGLLKETSGILLDGSMDSEIQQTLIQTIESDKDSRISDIHVWKVGPNHYAAMISIVTHYPQAPQYYKKLIDGLANLDHITIEVNPCESAACVPAAQENSP